MWFSINAASGVPIYQQLGDQIKRGIVTGLLAPGEKLPTVKFLALELTINPNTVAKVYRDLEREGFIETGGARGSFVSERIYQEKGRATLSKLVADTLGEAVREARTMGAQPDEIRGIIESAISRWYGGREDDSGRASL